jgi:hypothetical protein
MNWVFALFGFIISFISGGYFSNLFTQNAIEYKIDGLGSILGDLNED